MGNAEVLALLLTNGADVNAKAKDGYTALHAAESQGYTEIVQLLNDVGAEKTFKSRIDTLSFIFSIS